MNYRDYRYVALKIGGHNQPAEVLQVQEVAAKIPADATDCTVTWRRFPEAYLTHFNTTKNDKGERTVSKYAGLCYSDFIPFDVDIEGDVPRAHEAAKVLLSEFATQFGINDLQGIRFFFSGHKGFHLLLSGTLFGGFQPSADLSKQQQEMARKMAAGHDAVDLAIYDTNRFLRLENTKNIKSGLFKIGLTRDELFELSTADILELAKEPRDKLTTGWHDVDPVDACQGVYSAVCDVSRQKTNQNPQTVDRLPTGLTEGQGRDNAAFRLAQELRRQGVTRVFAGQIMELWNGAQADPLESRVISDKLDRIFVDGEVDEPITREQIHTPQSLADSYVDYLQGLQGKRLRLGWPRLDACLRAIAPGEVLTVIARSGVGKTAWMQNMLTQVSKDRPTLFVSMEQPAAQDFERYVQIIKGWKAESVENAFSARDDATELARDVVLQLGQCYTIDRSGLSIPQIEEAIAVASEVAGKPIEVVAVDYMGMMDLSGNGKDTYQRVSEAAKELKRLARRQKIVLIVLCQVSRIGGEDGSKALTSTGARDSGAIEESADYLLGLYRPELHGEDNIMAVQVLKNRKGQCTEIRMDFNRHTLRISEPIQDDRHSGR